MSTQSTIPAEDATVRQEITAVSDQERSASRDDERSAGRDQERSAAHDRGVAIIGAGLGGIGLAIDLRRAESTIRLLPGPSGAEEYRPTTISSYSCVTANSYYFDHHGDTPFLRSPAPDEPERSASFPA